MMNNVEILLTFAFLKFGINCVVGKLHRKKREKRLVGKLSNIVFFPTKSMRGVQLLEAWCKYDGLHAGALRDRCYMVVDSKGNLLSARKCSKMAAIEVVVLEGSSIKLISPDCLDTITVGPSSNADKLTVCLWEETIEAYDCGQEVSLWLDKVLGKTGLKLVYNIHDMEKRRCLDVDTKFHAKCKPEDEVTFQDGFPYMMMSTASVEDLNTRIKNDVCINNFRPNLVIDQSDAYDEDNWDKIFIGNVVFSNIKPCQRCIMTTVDIQTGKRSSDMEPLRTLRKYRLFSPDFLDSPAFGVNLVVDVPGIIKVGSNVYATSK